MEDELRKVHQKLQIEIARSKKAGEELQKKNRQQEAILNNIPDIAWLKDKECRFIAVNEPFAKACGFGREELVGKKDLDIWPQDLADRYEADDKEVMATGRQKQVEEPLENSKGNKSWIETIKTPIYNNEGEVIGTTGIARDVTKRKLMEENLRRAHDELELRVQERTAELEKSLNEKEVLLREIHHRVKNNMQIISSLLNHQMEYIKDKNITDIFSESQNRILSMALVHEKLYQSSDMRNVDFKEYINELGSNLFQSYFVNCIKLNMNVEDISLDIDLAIPAGLIINELITNSLKYAFPDGKKGEINISFRSIGDMLELVVSDNGIGLPKELDFRNTKTLGLHLVTLLAESQLHGKIDINRDKGTEFQIKFKGIK